MSQGNPTSDLEVSFYAGYGTLRECRWKGRLAVLPRVGEEVAIGDHVYDVEKVRHLLRTSKGGKHKVEVSLR